MILHSNVSWYSGGVWLQWCLLPLSTTNCLHEPLVWHEHRWGARCRPSKEPKNRRLHAGDDSSYRRGLGAGNNRDE